MLLICLQTNLSHRDILWSTTLGGLEFLAFRESTVNQIASSLSTLLVYNFALSVLPSELPLVHLLLSFQNSVVIIASLFFFVM